MLESGNGKYRLSRRKEAPPQSLLIVCDLNDERNVEGVLEPFGELEGYQVPQVQGLRGWALQIASHSRIC